MSSPPDLKVAEILLICQCIPFHSCMTSASFVLVLKNHNMEKLIPIVLLSVKLSQIRGQIIIISRFTVPCKAFRLSPFQSNQINQVLKQYFGYDMPFCVCIQFTTAHRILLHLSTKDVYLTKWALLQQEKSFEKRHHNRVNQ